MPSSDSKNLAVVLAIGVLVLVAPVAILALTVGFLAYTGDLVLSGITPLVFLELYVIDLLLFAGVTYGIYRLTLWLVTHKLPASMEQLRTDDADETVGGTDTDE